MHVIEVTELFNTRELNEVYSLLWLLNAVDYEALLNLTCMISEINLFQNDELNYMHPFTTYVYKFK